MGGKVTAEEGKVGEELADFWVGEYNTRECEDNKKT
jgi:hypothetical protein